MQEYKDKINLKDKIEKGERIVLDLGGGTKKKDGAINIDSINLSEVDIVTNLEEGLQFIPDNCVDEIRSTSFFEHINNFELLMIEIQRVLKKGTSLRVFVPHFSNPYYYSDYTHKRFFGYYTFYYFAKNQDEIKRKVPTFYNNCAFEIVSIKFTFSSPFIPVRILKNVFEKIINSSTLTQEFYEAHLTSFCSCYGLEAVLKVTD